jgi:2-oxo-hept-3-ene-1,7-dioate hydratase
MRCGPPATQTVIDRGRASLRAGALLHCERVADAELIDRAMKAQLRRWRDLMVVGMPRLGWKIGFNDTRVLGRLGLDGPLIGWLDGGRALRSGDTYALRPGTRVALEAEVAVRVGGGGAVAAVAPAFELVNYSLPANALDGMIEHDLFHEAVVFGRETLPVPIVEESWPVVRKNGVEVARRDPAMLVLQPPRALRDVATTLARYGEQLETNDWLILGTLIPPVPVHAGDAIEADFGPLGRVTVGIG